MSYARCPRCNEIKPCLSGAKGSPGETCSHCVEDDAHRRGEHNPPLWYCQLCADERTPCTS